MMGAARSVSLKRQKRWALLLATIALAFSTYIQQVTSLPVETAPAWPTFPRRHIAALARDGYLRGSLNSFKRSISTLAKNGQLPTFRSPYDETDKEEQDEDESHEKRNIASIARLRSYAAMKRNIQALARDGYRLGRGQYSQQNDKRNVQSLARNGMIHKKDAQNEQEFYYPFYQNPISPLSEIDGPFDINEMYDYQQSVNPDMFPPLSQVYKRDLNDEISNYNEFQIPNQVDSYGNWYLKRGGSVGMPAHGLLRPTYVDHNARTKRYILSLPDVVDHNDIEIPENEDTENNEKRSVEDETDVHDNFEKRHIGSLARKHSYDSNLGIREYISNAETNPATDSDYADVPTETIPSNSHPTGRILHRPLNNDLPTAPSPPFPSTQPHHPNIYDAFAKNRWQSRSKDTPRFYYFRSLKVPYHTSGKRYLLLPAVDNIMLRKNYPNSSLPSRRKNE